MKRTALISLLILGTWAKDLQAGELGLGIGRMYGCIAKAVDDEEICALGPAASFHLGLNLWGSSYRPREHERSSSSSSGSSFDSASGLNLNVFRVREPEDIVIVAVMALVMVSLGYAILYPFSSRADVGFIGRSGFQTQKSHDFEILRNELGLYLRGYLSQHVPLYIYGSGVFSHQNIQINGVEETHQVLIKRYGLGLMSPTEAGLYLQGTWERSSLLDPSVKDTLKDSTSVKIGKQSIAKILDASYFELGYIWLMR